MYRDEGYVTLDDVKDRILYKRIISVNEDEVILENGIKLTIECSEWDCCAGGGGYFTVKDGTIPLDAVITDITVGDQQEIPDDDTHITTNTITIFHNQNPIVEANATTDAGNGGYYYSITSLVINEVHFPFVEA